MKTIMFIFLAFISFATSGCKSKELVNVKIVYTHYSSRYDNTDSYTIIEYENGKRSIIQDKIMGRVGDVFLWEKQ